MHSRIFPPVLRSEPLFTKLFRLIAPENAKIVVKWYGFVLDGCHQGNNLRIVDGPKSVSFESISQISKTRSYEIGVCAIKFNENGLSGSRYLFESYNLNQYIDSVFSHLELVGLVYGTLV